MNDRNLMAGKSTDAIGGMELRKSNSAIYKFNMFLNSDFLHPVAHFNRRCS